MKKTGKLKGEATRERIVAAAIKLVSRHGFSETSFQMIADGIGLSQSAILHHFTSKTALVKDMLAFIVEENHRVVSDSLCPTDDARARLLKHFGGNIAWARTNPQQAQVLTLLFYLASFDKGFKALNDQAMEAGRYRILELLLAGKREGLFHLEADAALVAEILHETLVGGFIAATSGAARTPERRLGQKWELLVSALTRGASRRRAP